MEQYSLTQYMSHICLVLLCIGTSVAGFFFRYSTLIAKTTKLADYLSSILFIRLYIYIYIYVLRMYKINEIIPVYIYNVYYTYIDRENSLANAESISFRWW